MKFTIECVEINFNDDKSYIIIKNIAENLELLELLMRMMQSCGIEEDSSFKRENEDVIVYIPKLTKDTCNIIYSSILQKDAIIFQFKHVKNDGYNFYDRINALRKLLFA